ncbi:MAG: hypothetical protein UMU75_11555 [Halomonas sp.]|nr:hypothetical protein [Halomonas sp.]
MLQGFPLVRFINLGLRSSTLLAKFALIFLLAYFLDPADVALYGLMAVTIAYSIFGLGFDFYTFSTREIVGSEPDQWMRYLRDQGIFFGLTYTGVLPLLSLIFMLGLLPWWVAPWFFALVLLEHLAQELNRLLIAMSRQLLASFVLFLRSGLWALAIVALFWLWPEYRSLRFVFAAWTLGALAACLCGSLAFLSLDRMSLKMPVDWQWIRQGVKIAVPLLVATLAIRGVFTFDRYWVQSLASTEVLAAYVLYAGVANAVMSFLDAGVFVFLYPRLISAFKGLDGVKFRSGMRGLLQQTALVTLLLVISAAILIHPLLIWLDKNAYIENVNILYVLLLAIGFYALSMVPHYGLYAMSQDRHIIYSHVSTFLVFVALAATLTQWNSVYGVPLALCGAFSLMLIHKTLAYIVLKSRLPWMNAEATFAR